MAAPELKVANGDQGLKIRNLRKSYRKRPVIRDVSMDLTRGEVVALLGPNGSGKTTCFYAIAGLVMPDGGQVTIDGKDVTNFPMYRRAKLGIGYLPQERSIFQGLNVEDNILAILEIVEKDHTRRRERLEELLDEFSIAHLRRTPSVALSGGERRRCEIARSLAANPKYASVKEELLKKMEAHLAATGDPRMKGEAPWDHYDFTDKRIFKNPRWKEEGFPTPVVTRFSRACTPPTIRCRRRYSACAPS